MHHSIKPETGKRYGRLTVVSSKPVGKTRYGVKWLCVCDCGKRKVVEGRRLRAGVTRSCGCLLQGNAVVARAAMARNRLHEARCNRIVENVDEDQDALIAEELGL